MKKNRINRLFEKKKQNILSIYFTAGYPSPDNTTETLRLLQQQGVDMVEIGIPFSDPMADGPVIQQSSQKALENGMSLKKLFSQLTDIRSTVDISLLLMGYLNPVMQYGIEKFCQTSQSVGIDGVILPDLPLDVYVEQYQSIFERYNLRYIPLITPQTPDERIREIDNHTNGFIYMVSTAATTGSSKSINTDYLKRVKNMSLRNPTVMGFGIKDKESFRMACNYATGAIMGTAFIQAQEQNREKAFLQNIF